MSDQATNTEVVIPYNYPEISGHALIAFAWNGHTEKVLIEDFSYYPPIYCQPVVSVRAGTITSARLIKSAFLTTVEGADLQLSVDIRENRTKAVVVPYVSAADKVDARCCALSPNQSRVDSSKWDPATSFITVLEVTTSDVVDKNGAIILKGGTFSYSIRVALLARDFPKFLTNQQYEAVVGEEVSWDITTQSWAFPPYLPAYTYSDVDSPTGDGYSLEGADGMPSGLTLKVILDYDEETMSYYPTGYRISGRASRPGVYFVHIHTKSANDTRTYHRVLFLDGEADTVVLVHIRPNTPLPGDLVFCSTQPVCVSDPTSLRTTYASFSGSDTVFAADYLQKDSARDWTYDKNIWDNSYPGNGQTNDAAVANAESYLWLAELLGVDDLENGLPTMDASKYGGDAIKHVHLPGYWYTTYVYNPQLAANTGQYGNSMGTVNKYYYYVITHDNDGKWRLYAATTAGNEDQESWTQLAEAAEIEGITNHTPPRVFRGTGESTNIITFAGSDSYVVSVSENDAANSKVTLNNNVVDIGGAYGYIGEAGKTVGSNPETRVVFQQQPVYLPAYAGWSNLVKFNDNWGSAPGKSSGDIANIPDFKSYPSNIRYDYGLLLCLNKAGDQWRVAKTIADIDTPHKYIPVYVSTPLHVTAPYCPVRQLISRGTVKNAAKDVGILTECYEPPVDTDTDTVDNSIREPESALMSISNMDRQGWGDKAFGIFSRRKDENGIYKKVGEGGLYWNNYPYFREINTERVLADIEIRASYSRSEESSEGSSQRASCRPYRGIDQWGHSFGSNGSSGADITTGSSNRACSLSWELNFINQRAIFATNYLILLCLEDRSNPGKVNSVTSGSESSHTESRSWSGWGYRFMTYWNNGPYTEHSNSNSRSTSRTTGKPGTPRSGGAIKLVAMVGSGRELTSPKNKTSELVRRLNKVLVANVNVSVDLSCYCTSTITTTAKSSSTYFHSRLTNPARHQSSNYSNTYTSDFYDIGTTMSFGWVTGVVPWTTDVGTNCTLSMTRTERAERLAILASGRSGVCSLEYNTGAVSGRTSQDDVAEKLSKNAPILYPIYGVDDTKVASKYITASNGTTSTSTTTGLNAQKAYSQYAQDVSSQITASEVQQGWETYDTSSCDVPCTSYNSDRAAEHKYCKVDITFRTEL